MSPASSISMPPMTWGYLRPVSPDVEAIGLSGMVIAIGRTTRGYIEREDKASVQYVVLNGPAISNIHSVIHWNGREGAASIVTLTDYSMNGTVVDGVKVGPRNVHHLYNGSTVCFGCKVPILGQTDFRYIFHHAFGRSKTDSVLTHYELLDCVGSGAFGVVHRAIEKKSGKVFAIKTAFREPETERAPDMPILMAGQETMTMMVLEHDNICKLQEVFFRLDGEAVDIVLEYVDGVGLHRLGSLAGPLTEPHVREIAHQVCTAISYMHGKGVLHGDLKPNNILLTRAHPWTIKVIDFGLARVVGNINMQRVSAHIYTAPEAQLQQLRLENPSGALTHLWDSWGIGCILFNLHSSSHPFAREGEMKDSSDQDDGPFEVGIDYILWHLLDHCSPNARDVVRRLLAVDPHERMTVAAALHHPWLAGYEPYSVSFADVSFLPPSPASRIIPLEEAGADYDTERDEMAVDVRQVPASKAKGRRRQPQPQGGPRRTTRVKKASRPYKTPGDERHVKAGPGSLTRRSKRR